MIEPRDVERAKEIIAWFADKDREDISVGLLRTLGDRILEALTESRKDGIVAGLKMAFRVAIAWDDSTPQSIAKARDEVAKIIQAKIEED